MNLRSEKNRRSLVAGFTLLEAIMSLALVGVILGTIYNLSIRSLRVQVEAQQEHELAQMAKAVLDEYLLTYPRMASTGTYKNTWRWQIEERAEPYLEQPANDRVFEIIRVTVRVTRTEGTSEPFEMFTVTARKAKDP